MAFVPRLRRVVRRQVRRARVLLAQVLISLMVGLWLGVVVAFALLAVDAVR